MFDKLESSQTASAAASGVEFSGSVIDVMTESAGQMQLAMQDMANAIGDERNNNLNEATVERYRAGNDGIMALANFQQAESDFRVGEATGQIMQNQANTGYQMNLFGAGMARTSGMDRARGQTLSAAGGAFTGIAGYHQKKKEYEAIK